MTKNQSDNSLNDRPPLFGALEFDLPPVPSFEPVEPDLFVRLEPKPQSPEPISLPVVEAPPVFVGQAPAQTQASTPTPPVAAPKHIDPPINPNAGTKRTDSFVIPDAYVPIPKTAFVLMLMCPIVLLAGAHYSFSAALVAFAGLFIADIAIALQSSSNTEDSVNENVVKAAHATALVVVVFGAYKAMGEFSDMAFVAGLLAIPALLATLVLSITASMLCRRWAPTSLAAGVFQSLAMARTLVFIALVYTSVKAALAYTAHPDAIVALAICGLVIFNAATALRPAKNN